MKKVILITAAVALLITGISVGVYLLLHPKRNVNLTLNDSGYTLKVRTTSGEEIASLTESQVIQVKDGDYTYIVTGEGYDSKVTPFTVKGDSDIAVTPTYLKSYLPKLLENERPSAFKVLEETYPTSARVVITSSQIDDTGRWIYGKLSITGNSTDIYRFALHKEVATWKVVLKPTVALSGEKPKIPNDILYSLW